MIRFKTNFLANRFSVGLIKRLTGILLLSCFFSCSKEEIEIQGDTQSDIMEIPRGFPEMQIPTDNQFTQERWMLGKKLFFDPVLSIDGTISCGKCHKPNLAFADSTAFSDGVFARPGTRNSPSLANVGFQPYFLREGSIPTLEMQALVPIQEENEFNHNIVDIAANLDTIPLYVSMSLSAYNRRPDAFVITRALATFQRSLISGNSSFDKFHYQNKNRALSESQKRGMDLFFSNKTNCSSCHGGFNFTNNAFENNGLDTIYSDPGRQRFTGLEIDRALFKVPSLRNVGLTSPYMHNGKFKNLEEVINHYNKGGEAHSNRSDLLHPLKLKEQEKKDLIEFLKSLTDYEFIENQNFN